MDLQKEQELMNLLELAEQIVKSGDAGSAKVLALTEPYLRQFDAWQAKVSKSGSSEFYKEDRSKAAELVGRLNSLHAAVLEIAGRHRDELASQLTAMHRRAQDLKKYIDNLPPRITIAGKREG